METPTPVFVNKDEDEDNSNSDLFPTENILKIDTDRYKTNIWVSRSVFQGFKEACHISGRKSCDVIEPFMRAYTESVKKSILEPEIELCPLKPVIINLSLHITEKYDKRGPKPKPKVVYVPMPEGKIPDVPKVESVRYRPRVFCDFQSKRYNMTMFQDLEFCRSACRFRDLCENPNPEAFLDGKVFEK
jgi:hypothetical protein